MANGIDIKTSNKGLTVLCDACGYRIEGVNLSELEGYVDHACPKCGANMLTRSDYEMSVALAAFMNDSSNSIADKFSKLMTDVKPGNRDVRILDGAGVQKARVTF